MGEIDWIPDGRCSTQEAAAQEESPMEATQKLMQSQVREIFVIHIIHDMRVITCLSLGFWSRVRDSATNSQMNQMQATLAAVVEHIGADVPVNLDA